jgi:hypothetical protein
MKTIYLVETRIKTCTGNVYDDFTIYYLDNAKKKVSQEYGFTFGGQLRSYELPTRQRSMKGLIRKYHSDYLKIGKLFKKFDIAVTKIGEL